MQEILYNGNIVTNNEQRDVVDAMIINDGSVFFAGSNEEVLNLKTEDTAVVNLEKSYVYPTLFDLKANIFDKIDKKLKSAKKIKKFQVSAEIDEDYENFANFEEYKNEYLKLEKQYIKNGISTIIETNIDKLQFAFWKKMAEEKLLTLDVVCYVDLIDSKQVMDDNCVTYRKYKNHVRLAGYYIKIDGRVQDLKAWLTKAYNGTRSFYGSGELYGEQLYYLIKTALEERKQIFFELNGDKSIGEVLTVLKEVEEKNKINEFYRPIFYGAAVLNKCFFADLKHFDITILFEEFKAEDDKLNKKFLGFVRNKFYHNYMSLLKNNIRFTFVNSNAKFQNFTSNLDVWFNKKRKLQKIFSKNTDYILKFRSFLFKLIYSNSAYICFDQDTKSSIETQKQASFVIFKDELLQSYLNDKLSIKSVFVNGEKKY